MVYKSEKSASLLVKELVLKNDNTKVTAVIGVPKENKEVDKRIALTPESVALLVASGYRVLLEAGAGLSINYSDRYYAESGAEIVATTKEVLQADIVLKILPFRLKIYSEIKVYLKIF